MQVQTEAPKPEIHGDSGEMKRKLEEFELKLQQQINEKQLIEIRASKLAIENEEFRKKIITLLFKHKSIIDQYAVQFNKVNDAVILLQKKFNGLVDNQQRREANLRQLHQQLLLEQQQLNDLAIEQNPAALFSPVKGSPRESIQMQTPAVNKISHLSESLLQAFPSAADQKVLAMFKNCNLADAIGNIWISESALWFVGKQIEVPTSLRSQKKDKKSKSSSIQQSNEVNNNPKQSFATQIQKIPSNQSNSLNQINQFKQNQFKQINQINRSNQINQINSKQSNQSNQFLQWICHMQKNPYHKKKNE